MSEKFPRSFARSLSCAHAQAEPFVSRVGLRAAYVKAMGFEWSPEARQADKPVSGAVDASEVDLQLR